MFALLESASAGSTGDAAWLPERRFAPARPCAQPLSFIDTLAAPTVFIEQALLFTQALAAEPLAAAVAAVVEASPGTACRLRREQDGALSLVPSPPGGGVALLQGSAAQLTLQQAVGCAPELPRLLFGHLPGALLPAYAAETPGLPLVHVCLLALAGGGCVVGLRVSHLLGDWSSCRLLLRTLAAAYTSAVELQQPQSLAAAACPALPAAAPLLDSLLAQSWQQQQQPGAAYAPLRLRVMTPADAACFEKLGALASSDSGGSAQPQRPVRLVYHVTPSRIAELKASMQAAAAAAAAGSDGTAAGPWCSTHNVLAAAVLAAFVQLPGRQALQHDVSVAVDMRQRLPPQQQQLLAPQQQEQLPEALGNFFASAIVEGWRPPSQPADSSSNRAELARALHAAVRRACGVWLPDHAWAAGMSRRVGKQPPQHQPGAAAEEQPPPPQITWTRLHAMGPTKLLPAQVELGLLPSLSTTQWPLDFAADAAFAGQLPVAAAPGFSQPQPYPLLLTQQAAPAQGAGGWFVHVFLDADEATAFNGIVEAAGGL